MSLKHKHLENREPDLPVIKQAESPIERGQQQLRCSTSVMLSNGPVSPCSTGHLSWKIQAKPENTQDRTENTSKSNSNNITWMTKTVAGKESQGRIRRIGSGVKGLSIILERKLLRRWWCATK